MAGFWAVWAWDQVSVSEPTSYIGVDNKYSFHTHCRYYVLIAACVFARKTEWIRNACLAAALLFPAVGAIHAIVLAALHVDGEHS